MTLAIAGLVAILFPGCANKSLLEAFSLRNEANMVRIEGAIEKASEADAARIAEIDERIEDAEKSAVDANARAREDLEAQVAVVKDTIRGVGTAVAGGDPLGGLEKLIYGFGALYAVAEGRKYLRDKKTVPGETHNG